MCWPREHALAQIHAASPGFLEPIREAKAGSDRDGPAIARNAD
jgi:hypothetical protein